MVSLLSPLKENPIVATFRAMFGPAALGVVAATIAGAFWDWRLIPVGMVAWVVAVYLTGPGRLRGKLQARRQRQALVQALPPRLRPLAAQIDETAACIGDLISSADDSVRDVLGGLAVEVEQVGVGVYRLLESARRLYSYLQTNSVEQLSNQEASLQARIAVCDDDFTRSQLREAAAEVAGQREAYRELELLLQRTEAALQNMASSLNSVHSQVVKLVSGELVATADMSQESFQHLAEVRGTVAALQEVIDTTVIEG